MDQMTGAGEALRERELGVAREIAHAFLTASTSVEVYRLALARVTPLVRATFSSVFERDPSDPTLLKLTCAHNWPQSSARYLGQLRVREGRGPTGRAVADACPVEVRDVFADPALVEWVEPARELGFVSLISLPLRTGETATGAVTFYFDAARDFDDDERHLLMLVAEQLAVTAQRAGAMDDLRLERDRLRLENDRLNARIGADEEMRRLKDEFLSNISHELRTPLNSILGYSNLLTEVHRGALDEEQLSAAQRIERSALVLMRLISDLLELSQLRLGRVALNVAPDDAVLITKRAMANAGEPRPGVTLELDAGADRIPMVTDGEKIVKVLENLLTNAVKFTGEGRVDVSVRALRDDEGARVEWVVKDTGIGIPADKHDAIFDEFRQVDGSSTRLYGGTGLGLSLSRSLARLLGGRVTVKSEYGVGSEFRFSVPLEMRT
ncbi:MAG TPA: GAF domain-containing sensor histidine kinase [Longimicrobiales bacterium]|nr:GAF domain-containing sensor histidine kinase [Longimicrobiales bacterium]